MPLGRDDPESWRLVALGGFSPEVVTVDRCDSNANHRAGRKSSDIPCGEIGDEGKREKENGCPRQKRAGVACAFARVVGYDALVDIDGIPCIERTISTGDDIHEGGWLGVMVTRAGTPIRLLFFTRFPLLA